MPQKLLLRYRYIAIEGNIGVGKTTLAKLLAKQLKTKLVLEKFRKNHFLPLFYNDMEKYGLHVELSFLIDRFEDLQLLRSSDPIVADYFFSKTLLFSKNNLDKHAFKIFERVYRKFESTTPMPDLILFLYRDIPDLLENIKMRGRKNELQIKPEYLSGIEKAYQHHFSKSKQRILYLDISNIDFIKQPDKVTNLISLLNNSYNSGITKTKLW